MQVMANRQRPACRLLHLEGGSLGEVGVRSVVYFVRASIPNTDIIADQVQDLNRWADVLPALAAWLPRHDHSNASAAEP